MLLLSSAGYLDSLSSAQSVCGEPQTTPIRVEGPAGVDTLRAALTCASGGEVEAEWVGPVVVTAPIVVGEGTFLSVTAGDDLAEVQGGSTQTNGTRLFEVSQGGGLTLTGLKLSGGFAGDGGAVHSVLSDVTLTNCVFDGNAATAGSGGAVWADRGSVTIVGGEFLRNNATRYGGAVYAGSSLLEVREGSRFVDNTAIAGGALFCGLKDVGSGQVLAECSIAGAEFVHNSAVREDQGSIDDFSYLDGGGAAMFLFAEVNITDSAFGWNHARLSGGAVHGGANTKVSVSGCRFGNNTSEKYAGAISAAFMTLGGGTELTNNSAPTAGGAVSAAVPLRVPWYRLDDSCCMLFGFCFLLYTCIPRHEFYEYMVQQATDFTNRESTLFFYKYINTKYLYVSYMCTLVYSYTLTCIGHRAVSRPCRPEHHGIVLIVRCDI